MSLTLDKDVELEGPLKGYKLLSRLGRGGFGEVWKVVAPGGFEKAVKIVFGNLNDVDDESSRATEQELKALDRVKSIRHPYILSLERYDLIEGKLFIVMELADRNLWDRFKECKLQKLPGIPRPELIRYMLEAAEAIDLMNQHYQIQHLDIKPQNIFLLFDHIKVADFGLAKILEEAQAVATGGVTPVYAAPETFEGFISRYTDQYSLAILYQEMLTGTRPFNGPTTKQLMMQHLYANPSMDKLEKVDQLIIERALAKTPDQRWPSCRAMVEALRDGVTTPLPKAKPEVPPPAPIVSNKPNSATLGLPNRRIREDSAHGVPTQPIPVRHNLSKTPPPPVSNRGPLSLLTPGLVTPRNHRHGDNPMVTVQRPPIFQTERMGSLGIAPPPREGDGILFPSLILAVGKTGLAVLEQFRTLLRGRFGPIDDLHSMRFLYIDTDVEGIQEAAGERVGLQPHQMIHASLHRPAHYMQNSNAPNIESWLPTGMLYRLPRNPSPANGVRAFGRLALCDNYRVIAQRVRQEVETFLTDTPLEETAAQSGLGIRSNRPRVYILTNLAGGTGSGMLLDLAYIIRNELRSVGYRNPDIVGMLMVPPVNPSALQSDALANSYAALSEICHFTTQENYEVKFDNGEPPIKDSDGPLGRATLIQLPVSAKPKYQSQVYGQVAWELYMEMLTPTGRSMDYIRSATPMPDDARGPAIGHIFGHHILTWPQAELLNCSIQRFCVSLLQRWAGKESAHLREPIGTWLDDQWAQQEFEQERILDRFNSAASQALHDQPEEIFRALLGSLRATVEGSGRLNIDNVYDVFDQIIRLVGKPDAENGVPGSLEETIKDSLQNFAPDAESRLATMAVSFVEQPQYRLAGAEQALELITKRIKASIAQLEKRRKITSDGMSDAFLKALKLIAAMGNGNLSSLAARRIPALLEMLEVMEKYAQLRYRLMLLDAGLTFYRTLLGTLPDYLRDIAYCRTRLAELEERFPVVQPTSHRSGETLILPPGCRSVDDLVNHFLGSLAASDILEFDQALQALLKKKLRGLVNVCLKPRHSAEFVSLVQTQARDFLRTRVSQSNSAKMFLTHLGEGETARQLLAEGVTKSVPTMTGISILDVTEAVILATPPGSDGDRLRALTEEASPGVEFIPAPLPENILIHREYPRVDLMLLPHLKELGKAAFQARLHSDATPITRSDVSWVWPN